MVREIWKKNGFKGFYRGLWATMARESVGSAAFFGTYELTRGLLTPADKRKEDLNVVATMAVGALSSVTMLLPSYPMDVIKSRVQMSEKGVNGGYRAVWNTIGSLRTLYSGLWPTLAKSVLVSGMFLFAAEITKRFLSKLFAPNRPTVDSPFESGPLDE
ncbi:mitochondrial ornithine transporter 1-like [Sipha flava]|uniref:Mitochondrial ornithine transporter 1-like n=1 Tax=Sipha flava TaxID=143950 RepID=A0A8B8FRS4_9HEMI|nr:mitochondrial ornithine transporter 1-like [Sipha flava]